MSGIQNTSNHSYFKTLPKVELHRHLEGSIRLKTIQAIARVFNLDLPHHDTDRLRSLTQVHKSDPFSSTNFLSKFENLRTLYRSSGIIQRITREAIEDAAEDNIRYLELRFTPVAQSKLNAYPFDEIMDWVIEAAEKAEADLGVKTRLIASINRHESVEAASQVAEYAAQRISRGIIGLDLAGSEAEHSGIPFAEIFRDAKQSGLKLTIHGGEWGGAENVREAIEVFESARVGHGVRVMEDPYTVALARERGTVFEVCVTSNLQSGVVDNIQDHQIKNMEHAGLNVTINTDDPSICGITLSSEYSLIHKTFDYSYQAIQQKVIKAAEASFLPPGERVALIQTLRDEFPECL